MKKKFLYVGIILFLIGGAIEVLLAQPLLQYRLSSSPIPMNLSVNASSFRYASVSMNQTGVVVVTYNSTRSIDFILASSNAFGTLRNAASNKNMTDLAAGLEGNGVYEIYLNSSDGMFPYTAQYHGSYPQPAYIYTTNETSAGILQGGTYYAIFINDGNATANIVGASLTVPISALQANATPFLIYSSASLLLMIVGVIVIVISFFLKEGLKGREAKIDEEAEKAYEKIEKGRK